VEVVRGPQNALYGRGTFAGAINYVTRRPGEEFYGELEATAAQDNEARLFGIVSGPLAGDWLAGRLALGYETDDGTYTNGNLSGGLGGFENWNAMGTLRFMPHERVDILLDAMYTDMQTNSAALGRYPNNCGINPSPFQNTAFYTCGEIPGAESTKELGLSGDAYSMKGEQSRLALTIDIDFDAVSFTSISAYSDIEQTSLADMDRTQGGEANWGHTFNNNWFPIPAPVDGCINCGDVIAFDSEIPSYFNANSNGGSKYWSQEFRFASSDEQRLRWIGGMFYFNQESDNQTGLAQDISSVLDVLPDNYRDGTFDFLDPHSNSWYRSDFSPMNVFTEGAKQNIVQLSTKNTTQWAAFGAIDYDFTDQWTGGIELRYTNEKRELVDVFDSFFGTGEVLNDTYTSRNDFVDPRFNLRYQHNESFMYYGSVARGSRTGDCNAGTLPDELSSLKCYDPERNWTYELGARTGWFNNTLSFNATAFYVDWSDMQFRTQVPEVFPSTITTNLGALSSKGVELEVQWLATDGLTLSAGVGTADPKFEDEQVDFGTSALCSSGVIDPGSCLENPINPSDTKRYANIEGNQLRRTSDRTVNFGLQYFRPVTTNLDWYTRWDYRYQSKQYQEMHNELWTPSLAIVNGRIGLRAGKVDVSLWVRNLMDENAPMSAYAFMSDLNSSDSVTSVVNRERRRFGLTLNMHF
jgi:iron complex outermembrane receptor protein